MDGLRALAGGRRIFELFLVWMRGWMRVVRDESNADGRVRGE
jgi:hypothetical protein